VTRRSRLAFAIGLAAASIPALVAAIALVVANAGGDSAPAARLGNPERCLGLAGTHGQSCYTREFLAMVIGQDDPRTSVQAIAQTAWREGGFLLSSCHSIMHTVGRRYARSAGVTLANLMDYLPTANDPGCSAGFAHGLVTGVAPQLDPRQPGAAAAVCAESATRFQRYSCIHGFGHAFMRINNDLLEPGLALCSALGPQVAPDCAQGAFHDYWLAVRGADEASVQEGGITNPRELCAAQRPIFVRACWYRAFLDSQPRAFSVLSQIRSPDDLLGLCEGLTGLQREGCITAASVIGPPDPPVQLAMCASMPTTADAVSCVHGTKVQNMLGSPTGAFVELIGRCELFADDEARLACYRWLGKTLAVMTDGVFAETGCPKIASAVGRRQCLAGAATMEDALVTFS
jgi:hypothetical protein